MLPEAPGLFSMTIGAEPLLPPRLHHPSDRIDRA
jgi:hypothetical protein